MSAISVLLAPRDEALGERIADALSRGGHTARVVSADFGDLDLERDVGDDASIVVWSKAALKLARLHEQARDALDRGALIPVAVGGAPAPSGFETLPPVDLSGWQGDDGDPRWRFVLEEINYAAERRRLTDQEIWVTAQREAMAQTPPAEDFPQDYIDAEFADSPAPTPSPSAPIAAYRKPVVFRKKFDAGVVAVGGVMTLCLLTGAAIILAPAVTNAGEEAAMASLREPAAINLGLLQPVEPVLEAGAGEAPKTSGPAVQSPLTQSPEPEAEAAQEITLAALGPSEPVAEEPPAETPRQPEDAAPAEPAVESMDSILASVPELNEEAEENPSANEQSEYAGNFFKDCAACPDMAAIEGGAFFMGSRASEGGYDAERPQTPVTINGRFAMGTREITFDQWEACVADGGCKGYRPYDFGWGRGKQPVVGVSFEDAQSYVRWLSAKSGYDYRLPTEAEWEFAARAGASTAFSFGDRLSPKDANYDARYRYRGEKGKGPGKPTVAGAYSHNAFGLFDMHGNLWEWTQDCWREGHAGRPDHGGAVTGGACDARVLKGGAFNTGGWRLRAGHRIGKPASMREQEFGFRVVRALD